jgi:hypothetical protein
MFAQPSIDSPAFIQQPSSAQANQGLNLPPVLPIPPSGVPQMAGDALGRLQAHNDEMRMDTGNN